MKNRSGFARGASVAILAAFVLATGACDDAESHSFLGPGGNVIPPGPSATVEETRSVSGVSDVVLDGVGRMFIRQGVAETLLVRTEERILPFIRTEQRGGRLVIGFEPGTSYRGQSSVIEFHLTVASLQSVEFSGVGSIDASGISTGQFTVVHTGVGSVDVSGLTATRFEMTRSGMGEVNVVGAVQQQSIVLGGQGDYVARNLDSATADITIRSAGSAIVQVRDRLDARIQGSGSVYYIGDPVVQRIGQGSGSVEQI